MPHDALIAVQVAARPVLLVNAADGTAGQEFQALCDQVGLDSFRTTHIALLEGRAFQTADFRSHAKVAIVDERLAPVRSMSRCRGRAPAMRSRWSTTTGRGKRPMRSFACSNRRRNRSPAGPPRRPARRTPSCTPAAAPVRPASKPPPRPVSAASLHDARLSLGYRVEAWDHSGTNINRLRGMAALAEAFGSQVRIADVDLDGRFEMAGEYGAALFLGTLYHLKNPFYVLETLAQRARFCFLSTRVARWSPDGQVRLDQVPVGYLLDAGECNADATNYWIFSPPGLELLAKRAGWRICASAVSGSTESDPRTREGDERMFLLLGSVRRK
jgi:hypothetical protein